MKGTIHKRIAPDGSVTYRVRARLVDGLTGQQRHAQRTFATRQEAKAQLAAWSEQMRTVDIAVAWQPRRRPAGLPPTIYFIAADDVPAIKIGLSRDVADRLRDLQQMCPVPLRLIGLRSPGGWLNREVDLHRRFEALRMWGEWFRAEEPLLTFIADHTYQPAFYYRLALGLRAAAYLTENRDVFESERLVRGED